MSYQEFDRITSINEHRSDLIIRLFRQAVALSQEMTKDLSLDEQQALTETIAQGGQIRLILELGGRPTIKCLAVAPDKSEILLFDAFQPKPETSH